MKFDTRLGPEGHQQHRVPDVYIENQGAIFLVRPVSAAALAWISEYVADDAHWFGNALAVEHRFIADLVLGMIAAGLQVR